MQTPSPSPALLPSQHQSHKSAVLPFSSWDQCVQDTVPFLLKDSSLREWVEHIRSFYTKGYFSHLARFWNSFFLRHTHTHTLFSRASQSKVWAITWLLKSAFLYFNIFLLLLWLSFSINCLPVAVRLFATLQQAAKWNLVCNHLLPHSTQYTVI